MKKILITGAGSYIGDSVVRYLNNWKDQYMVNTVDMTNADWQTISFAEYDTVFHVAGIAHVKETKENESLYYRVNRDLTVQVAQKAKSDGVSQFIFMSSMSVYGLDSGVITKNTTPRPQTNYGRSKLQAEEKIEQMQEPDFVICIMRPPMVYGQKCKGNFNTVVKLVSLLHVFPNVCNERSMIYIDNLCEFIRKAIDRKLYGVFTPQNKQYMNTSEMARWIAEEMGKSVFMSRFLGFIMKLLAVISIKCKKAFSTLKYVDMEEFGFDYCVVDTKDSVKRSI